MIPLEFSALIVAAVMTVGHAAAVCDKKSKEQKDKRKTKLCDFTINILLCLLRKLFLSYKMVSGLSEMISVVECTKSSCFVLLLQASEAFHPEKSRVSADKLADFIRAPITGDLLEVNILLTVIRKACLFVPQCVLFVGSTNRFQELVKRLLKL